LFTTVTVGIGDSGRAVRLNAGDILEVRLPEKGVTAAWKAEVDESILTPEATDEGVFVLEGTAQLSAKRFRASRDGITRLTMLYQSIEQEQIRTLSSFSLDVAVGHPQMARIPREQVPVPERFFIFMQVILYSATFAFISWRLVLISLKHSAVSLTDVVLGLLGIGLSGAVGIFLFFRIVWMLVERFWPTKGPAGQPPMRRSRSSGAQ
jgi:hypothetical protein